MKVFKALLFFIFSLSLQARPFTLNQDGIRYSLFDYSSHEMAVDDVEFFHGEFLTQYKRMYEKYNVTFDPSLEIRLCSNAKCFGKLTGHNWFVGGVFNDQTKRFTFQSPKKLKKKQMLKVIIAHEICHSLLSHSPKIKSYHPLVLEWACQSNYPSFKESASSKKAYQKGELEVLLSDMKSKNRELKLKAFEFMKRANPKAQKKVILQILKGETVKPQVLWDP